jgi:hypothetical protein
MPGAVRGNHSHLRRREAIVLLPGVNWSLHWDEGEGSAPQPRACAGSLAVILLVSPGASHAVRNDGDSALWPAAISSETYDPGRAFRGKWSSCESRFLAPLGTTRITPKTFC